VIIAKIETFPLRIPFKPGTKSDAAAWGDNSSRENGYSWSVTVHQKVAPRAKVRNSRRGEVLNVIPEAASSNRQLKPKIGGAGK
jgi:hypothetical protein